MCRKPIVNGCCCFNLESGGRATGVLGVVYGFIAILSDVAVLVGGSIKKWIWIVLTLNLSKNCK